MKEEREREWGRERFSDRYKHRDRETGEEKLQQNRLKKELVTKITRTTGQKTELSDQSKQVQGFRKEKQDPAI